MLVVLRVTRRCDPNRRPVGRAPTRHPPGIAGEVDRELKQLLACAVDEIVVEARQLITPYFFSSSVPMPLHRLERFRRSQRCGGEGNGMRTPESQVRRFGSARGRGVASAEVAGERPTRGAHRAAMSAPATDPVSSLWERLRTARSSVEAPCSRRASQIARVRL